jgi:HAD superfamily hydrolase (TIGR01509 family)
MKVLFFDLDGTLVNSMNVHVNTWIESLKSKNLETTRSKLLSLGGVGYTDTISIIAKENNVVLTNEEVVGIHDFKQKLFEKHIDEVVAYDLCDDLEYLKEKGVMLILVTSTNRRFAEHHLNNFFPNIFDYILGAEDFSHTKPHPEPYLKAWKLSGFEKDECFVIEDAPSGINSGNDAGIKTLGIVTSNSREGLSEAYAVFDTHEELFKFLRKEL